jgi:hypothetical protein
MPPRHETVVALASSAPSPPGPSAAHRAERSVSPVEPASSASEQPAPPNRTADRLPLVRQEAPRAQFGAQPHDATARVLLQMIRAGVLARFAYSQRARDRQPCTHPVPRRVSGRRTRGSGPASRDSTHRSQCSRFEPASCPAPVWPPRARYPECSPLTARASDDHAEVVSAVGDDIPPDCRNRTHTARRVGSAERRGADRQMCATSRGAQRDLRQTPVVL